MAKGYFFLILDTFTKFLSKLRNNFKYLGFTAEPSIITKQQLLKNNFKVCFEDYSIKIQIFPQFLSQNYSKFSQVSQPSAFKTEKITSVHENHKLRT